jgi:hypothetical protein
MIKTKTLFILGAGASEKPKMYLGIAINMRIRPNMILGIGRKSVYEVIYNGTLSIV